MDSGTGVVTAVKPNGKVLRCKVSREDPDNAKSRKIASHFLSYQEVLALYTISRNAEEFIDRIDRRSM